MEDKELKKELDKIPDVDENGDPIYKIDDTGEDIAIMSEESKFRNTPQDLKDETSQE
jgi:hypothetical protein